jgi:deoxycytidylate deaminase
MKIRLTFREISARMQSDLWRWLVNTNQDPRMLAAYCAGRSTHVDFRHGAVVVDSAGRKVCMGWNHDGYHAERDAFRRSNRRRLSGATIFVVGLAKHGRMIKSKPCERLCLPLCVKWRIAKVVYSDPEAADGFRVLDLRPLYR